MASAFKAPHIIEPTTVHNKTIIFLHGRGSQGQDFAEELAEGMTTRRYNLFESVSTGTKWIFPSANERFSTVFQEEMDEWFDIYSLSNPNDEQERQKEGLKDAVEYTISLITSEIENGTEPGNIILGGISQGFATSVHALLACKYQLGGFIGLCGWLPFSNEIERVASGDEKALRSFYKNILDLDAQTTTPTLRTPVLISHAKDDNMVDSSLGKTAADVLRRLGMGVEWHEYEEGEHWISEPQGYDDVVRFIGNQIGDCLENPS